MTHLLFVGIGSPHGDDQIGWRIADELAVIAPPLWKIRKAATPADLFDWLEGMERLIVCDACRSTGHPGAVAWWRWPDVPAARLVSSGCHDLGLAEVLAVASELGRLPARVDVVGIEVRQCLPGTPISPDVAAALPHVIASVQHELQLQQ